MNFSPLMLGTVQFGLDYGVANRGGKPSFNAVCDMLAYAHEHGVNCLDTAAAYSESETIIGDALEQLHLRGAMKIVSKIAQFPDNLSGAELEKNLSESVQNSLRKLKVDFLDVCLFHHEKYFYALDALVKLRERGLIKKIGLSFSGASFEEAAKVLSSPLMDVVQVPGSILDRRFEEGGYAHSIPIFVRSVYLQGLLLMKTAPHSLREMQPALDQLELIAMQNDLSREALCVRYMLGVEGVCSLLMGVDNLAQLKENIALIKQGALPEKLHRQIAQLIPMPEEKWLCPALWPQDKSTFRRT